MRLTTHRHNKIPQYRLYKHFIFSILRQREENINQFTKEQHTRKNRQFQDYLRPQQQMESFVIELICGLRSCVGTQRLKILNVCNY